MSNYTDVSLVAGFLKRELTDNERLTLSVLIPAIQKWIDKKTGTTFLNVSATTRYFDGGESSIDIDPCTAITAVTEVDNYGVVNYTYVGTTDYTAEPLNETVKTELLRRYSCWPHGSGRIAVTAKFSYWNNGTPEDIRMAATKIAADTLMFNNGNNNVSSESLEGHSINYVTPTSTNAVDTIAGSDPFVKSVLALYTDPLIG